MGAICNMANIKEKFMSLHQLVRDVKHHSFNSSSDTCLSLVLKMFVSEEGCKQFCLSGPENTPCMLYLSSHFAPLWHAI
jgi:hypothetical protein